MSDKTILSQRLNEQLNDFRKAMDKFAESCTKIVEKYGLSSDETGKGGTMTNTKAIKELERQKMMFCHNCVHPQMVGWCENHCKIPEAYDMAINALKAQEKSQEVSNNSPELDKENGELISRQAAVDALRTCYDTETVTMDNGDEYINYGDAIGEIEQLPSAQPQRMRAKWIATTSLQEGQITWRDYKCSNCSHHKGKPMNFCEVCGAKMER